MWNEILSIMWIISMFAVILICLIMANMISGLYYSIGGKKQLFSFQKLLNGLFKGLAVLVANYLLAIALISIPYAIADAGIEIDNALLQSISIVILLLIWGKALISYALAVLEKIRLIFDIVIPTKTD